MSMSPIKILIIGPVQSGKSTIANYISEKSDTPLPYRPTAGVRILEFEKQAPKNPKRPGQDKVMIELWDVSGDNKYDTCWPMIQKGTHGIIFSYNVDDPKQESELENWVASFPKKMGIPASMCIAFAHHINGKPIKSKAKQPKGLTNLQVYDTSIEEGAATLLPSFDKFFNNLMMLIYERQEKEENNLMKD